MKTTLFGITLMLTLGSAIADHTVPALQPIYNLVKSCSTPKLPHCTNHLVGLKGELPKLLSQGYRIFGVGGIEDGGHIGCVPRFNYNNHDLKYFQRRLGRTTNHITTTQWEIERNHAEILDRFPNDAANLGYLFSTSQGKPHLIKLIRAYNLRRDDHMVFGDYSGERERVKGQGFSDLWKSLGYMYPRNFCGKD